MDTLDTTTISCTPVSLIQKPAITDTNDYYHRQYSMNSIASATISSAVGVPTMEKMYSSNYSDSAGTQLAQVLPSNHHSSSRVDSNRVTTKSNSLNESSDCSAADSLRSNFQRSHTCGSLFAKCGCSSPSPFDTLISNDNSCANSTIAISSNDQGNFGTNNSQYHSTSAAKVDSNPCKTTNSFQSCRASDRKENHNQNQEKRAHSKSTYVHPDIAFVFTDENKNPSIDPSVNKNDRSSTITTKNGGQIQLRSQQRLSSPNIGNYTIVDVAVHPEVVLKLSAATERSRHHNLKSSLSEDNSYCYTSSQRPLLKRSHREHYQTIDLASTPDDPLNDPQQAQLVSSAQTQHDRRQSRQHSTDSLSRTEISQSECSSYVVRPENYGVDKEIRATDDLLEDARKDHSTSDSYKYSTKTNVNNKKSEVATAFSEVSVTITPTTTTTNFTAPTAANTIFTSAAVVDPAQKFFQESGILGPLANASVSLIRKTSKIMQDSNVIEHIRKNSKLLRQGGIYKDELEYTRSLIPNIKIDMDKKDNSEKIRNLEEEISHLRDIIRSRDNEIYKLKREIHKLKSVLQQTTNHMTIATDDLLSCSVQSRHHHDVGNISPTPAQLHQANTSGSGSLGSTNCTKVANANIESHDECHHLHHHHHHRLSPAATSLCTTSSDIEPVSTTTGGNYQCKQFRLECLENNNNNIDGVPCATGNGPAGALPGGSKGNYLISPQYAVVKKQGVSGESSDPTNQQSNSVPIPKYKKDFRSKQLIKDAIMDNDFLKNIDSSQVRELVESMYSLDVAKGEYVIREGEVGAHLYVSAEGEFEVMKSGKVLGIMGPGKAFGELAILYNCTRTASIRCVTDARVWVLDRRVFQQIMMRTGMQRIEDNVNFLKSVPLLKNLSNEVLAKIADVLEVEFYPAGTYIIRQGASGDTFFLISQGTVKVTQRLTPTCEEKEIRTLSRGDYFGEQALINEDKRTANIIAMSPGVECLTLDRESFTHLIGDLCELKEKNYGDENRVLAMKFAETTKEIFGTNLKQELQDVELNDLEVVSTLGIGGFGRVELVKCYRENHVETYALKCLKKKHILDTRQEEHVFSERTIMLSCNIPFICRLYRTFKDSKYVYMLLEACMGGEVWTILRDRGCFDENTAQFIIGCVLQAFEYLHSRGIIYRDLKPENLMLDERGYVKLVDFGFAKYIGQSSKTWTFCGTPEYVAPEIILNKGHDRAVDYWALGILIHELLNGTPPFTANDPMKTYNIILKGIDMVDFPKHMSRSAIMLIKRLCRDVPVERLGYQKGGIQDIKKHKWFQGFDWDGLANLILIPPFLRPVSHPLDTSYFDSFPPDMELPPDEESGWDEDF